MNEWPKSSGMSYLYSGLRHSHLNGFYNSVLYLCTIQSYSDLRNRGKWLSKDFNDDNLSLPVHPSGQDSC